MKKLIITMMMLVGMVSAAWAQVDDVSLVVSGEGATKDEATTKALRSAIEQAFGVFVSANTEILNDELVRDEIATVSSGNVKKYTELGTINKPNGNIEVSLQAIVSVKKLTSYAKSHGSSAEFAGATFAQNLKLVELNRQNTTKAFKALNRQLASIDGCNIIWSKNDEDPPKLLYRDFYSCNLTVGNPKADGTVPVTLDYYTTGQAYMVGMLISNTLASLAVPPKQVDGLLEQGIKLFRYKIPVYSGTVRHRYQISHQENPSPNQILASNAYRSGGTHLYPQYYLYFYAPLLLPDIIGIQYDVYDNLGNKYDIKDVSNPKGGFKGTYVSNHFYANNAEHCVILFDCWGIKMDQRGWALYIPDIYISGMKKDNTFTPQFVIKNETNIKIPLDILSRLSSFEVKVKNIDNVQ